jgi:hypothetical protein
MTAIDPNQRLAAAMQLQLAGLRERARVRGGAAKGPGSAPSAAATARAGLAQRVQAIAADDPHRRQKAVRVYLEGELGREFGEGLLNDPGFGQMLDAVQQQMQEDGPTAAAVQALGDLLLAGQVPSGN